MPGNQDYRWWLSDKPHAGAWDAFAAVRERDSERTEGIMRNMRLYSNQNVLGFGPGTHAKASTKDRVTLNVIKSVIDTVSSRIGKNSPRPRFLTTAGNFTMKRKAKLLQRWADAQFLNTGLFKKGPSALLDACVFGTGILKVYHGSNDGLCVDRVFPAEIFVDQAEGMYGSPRQMFQCKALPKEVLKDQYPKFHDEIDSVASDSYALEAEYASDHLCEMVEVMEAWHLPSRCDADDGKHIICVNGATLFSEKWTRECFPFSFVRWTPALRGFWGIGLAEELTGIQIEINRLLQKIQKAMHLLSSPQVWVESSSNVKTQQMNNEIGSIYKYTGQRPVIVAPQTVNPEMFNHLENLYAKAYEIAGVSRMSAGSLKPTGLESGVALREYHDMETERFALISRAYEDMFMDLTKLFVGEGRSSYESNPTYSVDAKKDRNTIAEIKWEDVDLDDDSYVLQIFPASALPTTPSGRLAMVQDLLASGLLDPETGKGLLNFPDLEENLALDRAVSDNIDRIIELMLDDGQYEAPEPFQDHQLALKKVQAAYNRAVIDGVPEANLMLLREYMLATHGLMKLAVLEAQNTAPQPLPGAPPAAGPDGAPPTAVTPTDGNVM